MSGARKTQENVISRISFTLFVVRLGGVAGLLAIVLAVPASILASNLDPLLARAISVIPTLGLIIWLVGVSAFQRPHLGHLGSMGTIAAVVGLIALVSLQLLQAVAASAPDGIANQFLESAILPPLFAPVVFLVSGDPWHWEPFRCRSAFSRAAL